MIYIPPIKPKIDAIKKRKEEEAAAAAAVARTQAAVTAPPTALSGQERYEKVAQFQIENFPELPAPVPYELIPKTEDGLIKPPANNTGGQLIPASPEVIERINNYPETGSTIDAAVEEANRRAAEAMEEARRLAQEALDSIKKTVGYTSNPTTPADTTPTASGNDRIADLIGGMFSALAASGGGGGGGGGSTGLLTPQQPAIVVSPPSENSGGGIRTVVIVGLLAAIGYFVWTRYRT